MTLESLQLFSVETEQALLGAAILNNSLIDDISSQMETAAIYDPLHQRIWTTILGLRSAKSSVSPITLGNALGADPGLAEVGGRKYLAALVLAAPTMPKVKDLTRIINEMATRRALADISNTVLESVLLPPLEKPSKAIAEEATEAILALGATQGADRTKALSGVMAGRLMKAEERLQGKGPVSSITTGLKRLDDAIGGLQPGDHMLVCARSMMGKSAWAGCMARAAAMDGHPVLVISADMTAERWSDRTNCDLDHMLNRGISPIFYNRFRKTMFSWEIERLCEAQRLTESWAYDICSEGIITTARIRAKATAMANRYPGKQGLLVIDFLQKIKPAAKRREDNRAQELGDVAYEIGDIGRDLGWSVLDLVQLKNKDVDSKGKIMDFLPTEADIRESGAIIGAADIAIGLYRKAYYLEREEPLGRDYTEQPADWLDWEGRHKAVKNQIQSIGFKNRDDSLQPLNMTFWCEMGSNAVRDFKPTKAQALTDNEVQQLLA